ncbi:MAG: hypothetical protein Kow00124_26690 [Anaerolineae bacterium]
MKTAQVDSLPMEIAEPICREVQDRQWIKVFTQCWGCIRFSKGDPQKMCGGIVACNLVLRHYHRQRR